MQVKVSSKNVDDTSIFTSAVHHLSLNDHNRLLELMINVLFRPLRGRSPNLTIPPRKNFQRRCKFLH